MTANLWLAGCQAAVATSWSELAPECASAGVVSMLAWGGKCQAAVPSSKPGFAIRLMVGARLTSSNQNVPAAELSVSERDATAPPLAEIAATLPFVYLG